VVGDAGMILESGLSRRAITLARRAAVRSFDGAASLVCVFVQATIETRASPRAFNRMAWAQNENPTMNVFMDLSQPVNGTIVDGTGQCTIRIITLTINTGTADLSPDEARVPTDELVNYAVTWTVPEGRVWRDLKTIDLRFRQGQKTALLVHWDEAANTFSLCEGNRKGAKSDESLDCTAGALPGSGEVLQTESAQLYLAGTSVVGSGPTGRTVTLNLALKFRDSAAGPWYTIDLAASDDFGHQDDFVEGGKVKVEKAGAP